jgi:hypothetical protein
VNGSPTHADLIERVDALCADAIVRAGENPAGDVARRLRERLHEPLRVAIAGRVKAGKSTLLNALVGERLAATDASECTRLVTWYRYGISYAVRARRADGGSDPLDFTRSEGVLDIEVGDPAGIDWIEVDWPSARLEATVLIDTPGLAGMDAEAGRGTLRLLGANETGESQVDAVVYLMRHLHHQDAGFLETFGDEALPEPSPANAIAVLSRADEIGAGRLDALESAAVIAARYARDPRVRSLCVTVVPVAGLLAETGSTLREDEVTALREFAALPEEELADALLSVDRFCDPAVGPLPSQTRRDLLERFGLFGVRYCLRMLQQDPETTGAQLARALREASGIDTLTGLLEGHFGVRSRALKARSVLAGLRAAARTLAGTDPEAASAIDVGVEELWTTAHELAELRLWHLVVSGAAPLAAGETEEVRRVTSEGSPAVRLGMDPETPAAMLSEAAAGRIARWRDRATHPLVDRPSAEAYEIIARAYEAVYAEIASSQV